MSFLEALVKKGLITDAQVSEIKTRAKDKHEGSIDNALIELGISEDTVTAAKAEYLNIPYKKINAKEIPFEVLRYIPQDSAAHYGFAPFGFTDGVLEVGVTEPENIQAMDALQFISANSGVPFKIYIISKTDYKAILGGYSGLDSQVDQALDEFQEGEFADSQEGKAELEKELKNAKAEEKIVEDAPVIKIVGVILSNAIDGGASDIHIEHTGDKVKVRYRVDGSLYTSVVLPPNVFSGIVARVKILAKLRLDEKRKPQDGSFSSTIKGRKIDFRVSTLPAFYGEKVEMRILDSEKGVKPLDQLGLSDRNIELLREAIKKPYGIILITGPTGSGKSTTLYSMMNELDKESSNIVSLEDPVEYHMPGINQSQVMPEIGYTFASGLRSILRQDPDIIMVGEIRDKETAQLAIQAALTGHLVLSTLHTNNAVGAVPRLVDMGIDPYLIAPTLILSVAQRLVKMTCETSRKEVPMDPAIKRQIEEQIHDLPVEFQKEMGVGSKMYETVPSKECPTGTRGRIAVFEMFKVDKEMQDMIIKNPVNSELYRLARKQGMIMMREDAMRKAVAGITPWSEVYNFNTDID